MSGRIQIREVQEQDIGGMATAYVEAIRSVDPSEQWNLHSAEALLRFLVHAQPDLSFVAEVNGTIVGGISGIAKPWWDGCHLVQTELFISPQAQRLGVGSALFHSFLVAARSRHNATHIEAITFRALEFPSSWYTALGFEDKTDWKVIFGDVKLLCERLELKMQRVATSIDLALEKK